MADEDNKSTVEKYLSEFIRANIITQQIHKRRGRELVKEDNQDWVDGGVYLYRTKKSAEIDDKKVSEGNFTITEQIDNDNEEYEEMTYIKPDEFKKNLGYDASTEFSSIIGKEVEINKTFFTGNAVNNMKFKFTLDEDTGNVVMLSIRKTSKASSEIQSGVGWFLGDLSAWLQEKMVEEHYYVTPISVDYREYVSKYAMPYEFLINLCEITQNPEFVYHVALLARETEIVLVVQDNETVERETVEQDQYKYHYKNYGSSSLSGASRTGPSISRTRTIIETFNQDPFVTVDFANTWSYYDENIYSKTTKQTVKEKEKEEDIPPTGPLDGPFKETIYSVDTGEPEGERDYWAKTFVEKKVTNTQTVTLETEYNLVTQKNSVEKSKQFLGMLRNDYGKCIYDCYTEKSPKKVEDVIAIDCAKEAEWNLRGTNVKYRIPGMTKEEMPLNRLTSGIEMLYAALQNNTKGYESLDMILTSGKYDINATSNSAIDAYVADGDYNSAYYSKMQVIVEHLRYLMTYPENEEYTPKTMFPEELENEEPEIPIEEVLPGDVSSDYIVKTDEEGALPAVSAAQLDTIINGYLSGQQQANAKLIASTLIDCQNKYKVNAVFVLAFARQESSIGTANSSYVKKNNWLSYDLKKSYASPQANVEKATHDIAYGKYYFQAGKITIADIGYTYCPNEPNHPSQGNGWVANVTKTVKDMYAIIGIDIDGGEYSGGSSGGLGEEPSIGKIPEGIDDIIDSSDLSGKQQQLLNTLKQLSSLSGIAHGDSQCQKFVRTLYEKLGINGSAVSATAASKKWGVSSDLSKIPIGATIYGKGSSSDGHVGIYIGNGKVVHNIGSSNISASQSKYGVSGIKEDSLSYWSKRYKFTCWGWQGGVDLST